MTDPVLRTTVFRDWPIIVTFLAKKSRLLECERKKCISKSNASWDVRNKKIQKEEKVHCVQRKAAFIVIHRMFWKYIVSQVHNPRQQNWPGVCTCQDVLLEYQRYILATSSRRVKKQSKQILWHGFPSDCNSLTLYDFACALRGKALPLSGTFEVYKRRSEESIGPLHVIRSCYRISRLAYLLH